MACADEYDRTVDVEQLRDKIAYHLLSLHTRISSKTTITLDYPVTPDPRYGYGKQAHPELYRIIDANRHRYTMHLQDMLLWATELTQVACDDANPRHPKWNNGFFPGLDAVALYSFLRTGAPDRFLEIGSGSSTKFARRAIEDGHLHTRITSIDPNPRAEIDDLCDHVVRSGLESVDLGIFENLTSGDIVFLDGSHRLLMSSDVMVFWLEVLPRLSPGILVQVHDVYLPYDYPPEWRTWWYSEQYLLATQILFGPDSLDIVLPNAFVSRDLELSRLLDPLWTSPGLETVERHGGSFWFYTRSVKGHDHIPFRAQTTTLA